MTLTNRGYEIKLDSIDKDELKILKEKLNVAPNLGDFSDKNESFKLYKIVDNKIIVPRYYGIRKYGQPTKNKLKGIDRDFIFNGNLRGYQNKIVEECYNKILEKGGGLLSVGCGRGKTVMAIKLAQMLKAKTLVVVHKTFLQDQWIERIKQFTDAKIGIIRQDTVEVDDKDIVIAMIQSLSMKDYDIEIFNDFKFVIYDEAHHCASKVFSNALYKTGANYTLALSATPDRVDGLKKVMSWYLGRTIYKEEAQTNKNVIVKKIKYSSTNSLFKEKTIFIGGKHKPHIPTMVNNIVEIEQRNNHLISIIDNIRKIPERKILVLSGRLDHLATLKTIIDQKINKDVEDGKIIAGEYKTYYYVGGMKDKVRREAETDADILFATYEMAHEGMDIERLNTIILATPKKNIIQSVGRIMRRILQSGDLRPLIIDMTDELSVFHGQGKKREEDYKKSGYEIDEYYLTNDKFITNYEYYEKVLNFSKKELDDIMDESDKIVPTFDKILDIDNIS